MLLSDNQRIASKIGLLILCFGTLVSGVAGLLGLVLSDALVPDINKAASACFWFSVLSLGLACMLLAIRLRSAKKQKEIPGRLDGDPALE